MAGAAIVVVPATAVGNYLPSGSHTADDATVSNHISFPSLAYRDYQVFDLTGVGIISSATLRTNSGGDAGRSDDVSISFTMFLGNIADLSAGTANYADLAGGTEFGSVTLLGTFPDNSVVDVPLNAAAIAALNGTTGEFAIAGNQPAATGTSGVFGETNATQVSLILDVVPEPSTGVLLIMGALGICFRRSRL